MNQEEFIEIIKLLVRDASIEGVEKNGQIPQEELHVKNLLKSLIGTIIWMKAIEVNYF
jgi:hypothetical protein